MSDLPEDLKALTAGAPEVADWPGLVRAEVRARHRRRAAVSAAAALVLVGVAGVGIVYAVDGPTQRLVAVAPAPEPTPTASRLSSPSASASPSPPGEPAPVPSPQPAQRTPAPPAPEPSAAPQASQGPSPTAAAYPPARNTITLEITVTPEQPVVGEEVTIRVVARGDKAKPYLTRFTYDRGRRSKTYPIAACLQQEPVAPEPGSTSDSVTFTYTEAGPETISVRADSGCSYYQGSNSADKQVEVGPAPEPTSSPGA